MDRLWLSVTRGDITWIDLRKLQAETMPRCITHDQPCNIRLGGVPLCVECMRERYEHV